MNDNQVDTMTETTENGTKEVAITAATFAAGALIFVVLKRVVRYVRRDSITPLMWSRQFNPVWQESTKVIQDMD